MNNEGPGSCSLSVCSNAAWDTQTVQHMQDRYKALHRFSQALVDAQATERLVANVYKCIDDSLKDTQDVYGSCDMCRPGLRPLCWLPVVSVWCAFAVHVLLLLFLFMTASWHGAEPVSVTGMTISMTTSSWAVPLLSMTVYGISMQSFLRARNASHLLVTATGIELCRQQ